MKLIITQPNFLPWIGYFAQIENCDKVIFLDNVQYSRREWQNRNRIIDRNGKVSFITLNICKAPRSTKIKDIKISPNFNHKKVIDQIYQSYKGSININNLMDHLSFAFKLSLEKSDGMLYKLNINLINYFCNLAKINCDYALASEINLSEFHIDSATDNLLSICKKFNSKDYLSSEGAREYMLKEIYKFDSANINILWQKFLHKPYLNIASERFVSHLSIIDFLANVKISDLKKYIKECHYEFL